MMTIEGAAPRPMGSAICTAQAVGRRWGPVQICNRPGGDDWFYSSSTRRRAVLARQVELGCCRRSATRVFSGSGGFRWVLILHFTASGGRRFRSAVLCCSE